MIEQDVNFRGFLRRNSELNRPIETQPEAVLGWKAHITFFAKIESLTATINQIDSRDVSIQIVCAGFQSQFLHTSFARFDKQLVRISCQRCGQICHDAFKTSGDRDRLFYFH